MVPELVFPGTGKWSINGSWTRLDPLHFTTLPTPVALSVGSGTFEVPDHCKLLACQYFNTNTFHRVPRPSPCVPLD